MYLIPLAHIVQMGLSELATIRVKLLLHDELLAVLPDDQYKRHAVRSANPLNLSI